MGDGDGDVRRKRHNLTPAEKQAQELERMFKNPEKAMRDPSPPPMKKIRAPIDIVDNIHGSSAGPGSGEFHVYKHGRRFEYERIHAMEVKAAKEASQAAFDARRDELAAVDEAKTAKNRARRDKKKRALQRAKEEAPAEDTSHKRRLVAPGDEALVFRKPEAAPSPASKVRAELADEAESAGGQVGSAEPVESAEHGTKPPDPAEQAGPAGPLTPYDAAEAGPST